MPANYVLLERIELNATAASITFSNIPQTGYTDLKVVLSARGDVNNTAVAIQFNGSTSSYSMRYIYGSGSGTASYTSSTGIYCYAGSSTYTASTFGNSEFYIPNYNSTSTYKSVSTDNVTENNATAADMQFGAGLWSNNSAITSITLVPASGNFVQYSTFSLYGLAAVGTTPVIAPKAVGGSIYNDGTYWYHAFLATDVFTPQIPLSCSTLVIAGGGAGGTNYGAGGGGGAGGLVYTASQTISSAQTVTIGAGATTQGALDTPSVSGNGSNSTLGSLVTAIGGGGGASYNITPGSGGSGGGAGGGDSATTGGSGTSGQGYAGGSNASYYQYAGAGGGGAGAVGGSASSGPTGGNGGAGVNTYSAWASATNTGVSGFYAGGGGGGAGSPGSPFNGTAGAGGSGGGGAGATQSANATNGTVNTGGGGGGIRQGTVSGKGGSGIVIIRYPIA